MPGRRTRDASARQVREIPPPVRIGALVRWRRADIQQVLGASFAGCIPNQYSLVREAIDRGVPIDEVKPGNKITSQLKRMVLPLGAPKAPARADPVGAPKKAKLSWAR